MWLLFSALDFNLGSQKGKKRKMKGVTIAGSLNPDSFFRCLHLQHQKHQSEHRSRDRAPDSHMMSEIELPGAKAD
jgi:hypothetical protein